MIKKYRKKSIVVDVIEFNGTNVIEVSGFIGDALRRYGRDYIIIKTLEGNHELAIGDFIIKGVTGEFYPCKPEIFKRTYDCV